MAIPIHTVLRPDALRSNNNNMGQTGAKNRIQNLKRMGAHEATLAQRTGVRARGNKWGPPTVNYCTLGCSKWEGHPPLSDMGPGWKGGGHPANFDAT